MGQKKGENGRRMTERTTLWLVLLTLVVGGGLAIGLVYGPAAILSALPILFLGAALILVPWALLSLLGGWRARREREERAALDQRTERADE